MTVTIRSAVIGDVYALAAILRPGDRAELLAAGRDPKRAIRASFRASLMPPSVALVDGEVAAMWGMGGAVLSDVGIPWMLTGCPCNRQPFALVRISRAMVEDMLEHRPRLENYVLASYGQAVGLLRSLGFTIGEPEVAFRKFSITKDEYYARRGQRGLRHRKEAA